MTELGGAKSGPLRRQALAVAANAADNALQIGRLRMWWRLAVLALTLTLAGCFRSDEPLFEASRGDCPFDAPFVPIGREW